MTTEFTERARRLRNAVELPLSTKPGHFISDLTCPNSLSTDCHPPATSPRSESLNVSVPWYEFAPSASSVLHSNDKSKMTDLRFQDSPCPTPARTAPHPPL